MRIQPEKRLSQNTNAAVSEALGFAYFIEYDPEGNESSIMIDDGVDLLLGVAREDIFKQLGWRNHIEEKHWDAYSTHRIALKEGKVGLSAYLVKRNDGAQSWIVDSARPVWDDDNNLRGIEGILMDLESSPRVRHYVEDMINLGRL